MNTKKSLYIYVDPRVYNVLKQLKETLGVSMSKIVENSIKEYSKRYNLKKPLKGKDWFNKVQSLMHDSDYVDTSTNLDVIIYV